MNVFFLLNMVKLYFRYDSFCLYIFQRSNDIPVDRMTVMLVIVIRRKLFVYKHDFVLLPCLKILSN